MQLNFPINRRRCATVIGLASLAAGVFLIFITRVFLLGPPEPPLRTCGPSTIFEELSFTDAQRTYHWTMEMLTKERMSLYEGTTLLACTGETMEQVIPPGELAVQVAEGLRQTNFSPSPPNEYFSLFTYADFERLLTEFFRTYDCHLFAAQTNPGLLGVTVPQEDPEQVTLFGGVGYAQSAVLEQERLRARHTLDRLLFLFRSSEQYLPLHASLRCLQRGGTDVRNALALLSDANQCLQTKLGQPETSLLQ